MMMMKGWWKDDFIATHPPINPRLSNHQYFDAKSIKIWDYHEGLTASQAVQAAFLQQFRHYGTSSWSWKVEFRISKDHSRADAALLDRSASTCRISSVTEASELVRSEFGPRLMAMYLVRLDWEKEGQSRCGNAFVYYNKVKAPAFEEKVYISLHLSCLHDASSCHCFAGLRPVVLKTISYLLTLVHMPIYIVVRVARAFYVALHDSEVTRALWALRCFSLAGWQNSESLSVIRLSCICVVATAQGKYWLYYSCSRIRLDDADIDEPKYFGLAEADAWLRDKATLSRWAGR